MDSLEVLASASFSEVKIHSPGDIDSFASVQNKLVPHGVNFTYKVE